MSVGVKRSSWTRAATRGVIAIAASAGVNLLLAFALAGVDGRGISDAAPVPTRIPLRVVESPPPPPPPPPPPEEHPQAEVSAPAVAQAALPPIELPPLGEGTSGLALPRTDESLYRFELPLEVPSYGARASEEALVSAGEIEPPRLLYPPDLARYYPLAAKKLGVTGRTLLALKVDARGRVEDLEVLKSEPPGVFERAAHAAAKRLKYRPATRGGRPQVAKVKLELKWRLED